MPNDTSMSEGIVQDHKGEDDNECCNISTQKCNSSPRKESEEGVMLLRRNGGRGQSAVTRGRGVNKSLHS